MKEKENLKPIVFYDKFISKKHADNTHMQTLLLKALSEGITDVDELKQISGVKSSIEVFRTLDKLALRCEYQEALAKSGFTLDSIVSNMKDLVDNGSDKVRLGALQTVLKSLGLDKYEKEEDNGKNWEETILGILEKKDNKKLIEGESVEENVEEVKPIEIVDYEVKIPEVPDSAKRRQKEEHELAKELYD